MPYQKDNENSFYNAICYAARFSLTNKKETCDENEMKDNLSPECYQILFYLKKSVWFSTRKLMLLKDSVLMSMNF